MRVDREPAAAREPDGPVTRVRADHAIRRDLANSLVAVSHPVYAQGTQFELRTATVADIRKAVAAGAFTYERQVQLYLNRIQTCDKAGPKLNAVIEVNSRALETARALGNERRTKGLRSPLYGIPVAVKDDIDVSDVPTAGGNLAFAGTYAAMDATVARKLRDAGAIILAKTNMDELALGSKGISSYGGQILNPYDLPDAPRTSG